MIRRLMSLALLVGSVALVSATLLPVQAGADARSSCGATDKVCNRYNTPPGSPGSVSAAYPVSQVWNVPKDPNNPLGVVRDWRQCSYWAVEERPDIYRNVSPHDPKPWNWAADAFPAHARLEGLTVNRTPAPGAIAIWPAKVDTAGPYGHAAYIERVNADGSFVASEYNDAYPGHGDWIYLTPVEYTGAWFIQLPAHAGSKPHAHAVG